MKTEIQRLRQRVAMALATKKEAKLVTDGGYEVQLEMRGARIGTVSTLKTMLNWIDEIVAEGKDEHRRNASGQAA